MGEIIDQNESDYSHLSLFIHSVLWITFPCKFKYWLYFLFSALSEVIEHHMLLTRLPYTLLFKPVSLEN